MNRNDFVKPDSRRMFLYSRRPISNSIGPTNPLLDLIAGSPQGCLPFVLAGFEIGDGKFVNDTWPQEKATELREVQVNL